MTTRFLPVLIAAMSLLLPAGAHAGENGETSPPPAVLVDYGEGALKTNVPDLKTDAALPNGQDQNRSLVLTTPGRSRIVAGFELPAKPVKALLRLVHLSSGANIPFGGESRIAVRVNDHPVIDRWDVGTGGFGQDAILVTRFLKPGPNTIELRFVAGQTCYWFRRLTLQCDYPDGAAVPTAPLQDQTVERVPKDGDSEYAVVIRRAVYQKPEWKAVADALVEKHHAVVILYPRDVSETAAELAAVRPRFAAFVSPPTETGRRFVVAVHRLTRRLDDDPYTDCVWGIITGYEPADALRIARESAPLLVSRGAAGCGLNLARFESGAWYSEGKQGVMYAKDPGGKAEKQQAPPDTTRSLVMELNENKPDFFSTSGHATERDWQIGYSYKNGQFRCQNGQLFGLDTQGNRYDINSPNPKLYLAAGNCLMGHIDGPKAMALAWMHTGGARQMVGYVVSTWFGYMGHGVSPYFVDLQGQHTFSESFFLAQQSLLVRLQREYPGSLEKNIDEFGIEHDRSLMGRIAQRLAIRHKNELGLLWDRDTVAFYGDPAWVARMKAVSEPAYKTGLEHSQTDDDRVRFTFTVTTGKGKFARPPGMVLPCRIADIKIEQGAELKPVISDDFVLVPHGEEHEKGDVLRIVFTARKTG